MSWRSVSITACSGVAALGLSGCGADEPRLPVLTALRLEALAEQVAAGRDCGPPLVAASLEAVNRREVPAPLQEQLLSSVNEVRATCSRAAARALADRLRP